MVELSKQEKLLEKANKLPLSPGVYLMRDKHERVIYVGKSRKLKNRVSQYFQQSQKNTKTERMVSMVSDFDYILCQTEIEALTLENTLIKQYSPKYNIRLKDAKNYPYIKITADEYPRILYTRRRLSDRGKYFGPFSGTSTVSAILDILHKSLGIPNCSRSFPRDIGKQRPCIYYQMNQCCGLCTGKVSREEYLSMIQCATEILRGHTAQSIQALEEQMISFAEAERFEAAAKCRDTIKALRALHQKQHVVASPDTNMDVFAIASNRSGACLFVMYIRDGIVIDKNDFSFCGEALLQSDALSAFLVEHYMRQESIPKQILLSFDLEASDDEDIESFLSSRAGHKVTVRHPERGEARALCQIAMENAEEKLRQSELEAEKDETCLVKLAELLALETLPERIEAYDISNIGKENLTAGMVVFYNGKPQKGDYRSFHIRSVEGTDDYASMKEALGRRFRHLKEDLGGSFAEYPDLILVDGGRGHVAVAREAMREAELEIPIFGMVKDEYHKTRALCTDREEINIAREQSVFILIYKIQEEVHRFTVGKTTAAKRKTMKHSSLEKIEGIGPVKAKKLMLSMGTLAAIKEASVAQLMTVNGISETDAYRIYRYYHSNH